MYLCAVCGACSKPNQPRKVWVIERHIPHTVTELDGERVVSTRTEIERELPVCHDCYKCLNEGSTLSELQNFYRERPGPTRLDEWPEQVSRRVYR